MREFLKDWRRWSRAERVTAVMILSISLIGLPAALALNAFQEPPARGEARAGGGVP